MSSSYGFDANLQHLIDCDLKSEETETCRDSPFSPTSRLQACLHQSSHLLGDSFLQFQRQLAQIDYQLQVITSKGNYPSQGTDQKQAKGDCDRANFRPLVLKNGSKGYDIY